MVTAFQFVCGCVDVGDLAKIEKWLFWDAGICLYPLAAVLTSPSCWVTILFFFWLGSGRNLIAAILGCAALKCKPS